VSPKRPMRRWVILTVLAVWSVTALGVWISTLVHPPGAAEATLSTSEVEFRTDAHSILGPSDQEELLVSELTALEIRGNELRIKVNGVDSPGGAFRLIGDPHASCSFAGVRSSSLQLAEPTTITLLWTPQAGQRSISLKTHGTVRGTITSQPSNADSTASFTCTRVHVNDGPASNVDGIFSKAGGDSLSFLTARDSRLDLSPVSSSELGDTQINVLSAIRFTHIDPLSAEEKTVLLTPPTGRINRIEFETPPKHVAIPAGDLLLITPRKDFFLRRFSIQDGIQLDFQGPVLDVRIGPGSTDLVTCMPTMFDLFKSQEVMWGLIVSITGVLIGILEKMEILRKK
jgi:hypothetical protein